MAEPRPPGITDDDIRIGGALRALRKDRDWKAEDFAAACKISRRYLSYIEDGHRPAPPHLLVQFADRLGVAVVVLTSRRWTPNDTDHQPDMHGGAA